MNRSESERGTPWSRNRPLMWLDPPARNSLIYKGKKLCYKSITYKLTTLFFAQTRATTRRKRKKGKLNCVINQSLTN